jgi:hypothetical protein
MDTQRVSVPMIGRSESRFQSPKEALEPANLDLIEWWSILQRWILKHRLSKSSLVWSSYQENLRSQWIGITRQYGTNLPYSSQISWWQGAGKFQLEAPIEEPNFGTCLLLSCSWSSQISLLSFLDLHLVREAIHITLSK